MAERYLDLTELTFVSGPLELPEGSSSIENYDNQWYPPEVIASDSIRGPGTTSPCGLL